MAVLQAEEITLVKKAGAILRECLNILSGEIAEGVTTKLLERKADEVIARLGAAPAFRGYKGFPASICASRNSVVVHGIPSDAEILRKGDNIAIFAIGSMVSIAIKAADLLSSDGIEATVINSRFVKPLDKETIEEVTRRVKKVVTLEEAVAAGGFGSAILEFFERENIKDVKIKRMGLPDNFIAHGKRKELLKEYHFTADEICETIKKEFFGK